MNPARYLLLVSVVCFGISALAWSQTSAPASPAPRPMTPVDMVELPRFGDVQVSADGRYLSFTLSRTDWAENDIHRDFNLLDLSTGLPIALALDDEVLEDLDDINWRPDGSGFLYLFEEEEEDDGPTTYAQVYSYDLTNQTNEQLTRQETDVLSITLNPNGQEFYFTQREARDARDQHLRDEDWVIAPYDEASNRELWRFDLDAGTASPLIRGEYSVRRVTVSRDGRQIVHMRAPDQSLDGLHAGDIWALDLETKSAHRLTQNAYSEAEPQLSPDGSALSYIATVGPNAAPYYEDKVFLERGDGSVPERLQSGIGFEANDHVWSGDGTRIYMTANVGLETRLFAYDVIDEALTPLTPPARSVKSWTYAPEADLHVLRLEDGEGPGELQTLELVDRTPVLTAVTSVYADWPSRYVLPRQTGYSYTARDGTAIEGLLVYPVGYEPGTAYPTVTIIHGGPRSASQFGSWNVSRYLPVLAGKGYVVFLPNHRGGTGYGDAFMRDMFDGYFQNAQLDVIDGIDALIADGIADADRLVVQGWSAGGHMVNRLITETDRFAAASSGAGASDWLSMHGESDVRHQRSFVFGGMPWERDAPYDQYEADSPLRQAWRVTTPTLFWSGEEDVRVPPTQSIMMHHAVKAAGAPTEFYQADGEPHNFRDPRNQLFKINRELEWYAEHVTDEAFSPVLPPQAEPGYQPALLETEPSPVDD